MDLKAEWKRKYDILKVFISSNPDISIGKWETSIPRHLRDEFFSLFDQVRKAFVESWGNRFFIDICALGNAYIEAEENLFNTLHLSNHIELPVDLATILHNPGEGMMRLIYDRLFELVQGKITEDDFERMAIENLNQNALDMYMFGYQLWAAISIMLLLEPDKIYSVSLDKDDKPHMSGIEQIVIGAQYHHASKRIPELILHSKRLNTHIAFKMPVTREVDQYSLPVELPTQRVLRDRTGDTSMALAHRMIFISVVPDLGKIPVFADLHERKITSPDLIIEFLMENDLNDGSIVGQIKNRAEIMKPRLGTNIVLMNQKSLSDNLKIREELEIFSTGVDGKMLQPIINKLYSFNVP